MTRIMILADYYAPAVRAGGPPASLMSILASSRQEILLVCRDRDVDSAEPFGAPFSGEVVRDGHTIFYADMTSRGGRRSALRHALRQEVEVLYLNSFHSIYFTLIPMALRLAGQFNRCPVMISPRGEFNPAALRLGSRLKGLYARIWRLLGLPQQVVWVAASKKEHDEIARMWGPNCRIELVPATGASQVQILDSATAGSGHGDIRTVTFMGRIAPIKGLLEGLTAMKSLDAPLNVAICGPIEDEHYWNRCQEQITELPAGVTVTYRGELARHAVANVLAASDALLLPTYGENFGHVICEALANSCPVIVGENTPWTPLLDSGAGWAVNPQSIGSISEALSEFVDSEPAELERRRVAALEAARAWQAHADLDGAFDALCDRVKRTGQTMEGGTWAR